MVDHRGALKVVMPWVMSSEANVIGLVYRSFPLHILCHALWILDLRFIEHRVSCIYLLRLRWRAQSVFQNYLMRNSMRNAVLSSLSVTLHSISLKHSIFTNLVNQLFPRTLGFRRSCQKDDTNIDSQRGQWIVWHPPVALYYIFTFVYVISR